MGDNGNELALELGATSTTPTLPPRFGPCSLGTDCTAKDQELSDQYRCRHCNRQLHGFISGCSQAKNPKDFRDGVICKNQPCDEPEVQDPQEPSRTDGAAIAAAAGLPKFLWETQQPKRKRDPNAPKQRRQRYTKEQKEIILTTLHNTPGVKLMEIARQFNIPEGTIRGWYDEERRSKAASAASAAVDDMGEIADQMLDAPAGVEGGMTEGEGGETTDAQGSAKKKRRQRYSNETKIQVILALETRTNSSLNEVSKEFGVAPGTVRGWREEADKIQKQAMENRRAGAKANPSRDPLRRVWDAILSLFEKNSRLPEKQRLEVNVAVVRTIGKQARDALLQAHVREPFLTETEVINMEKFKASETWARKWARDHQVMSTKPETSDQTESAQTKLTELQKVIAEFPPEKVYTMTPTALFYRILPHRTYVSKLANQKRVRACKGLKSKDRLTLYLCTNESGTDKLPITCIGKYESPACFQVAAQKNLPYLCQKQALSDAGTYQRWWRTVFLPHVRSHMEETETCLLLVEDMGPCKAELLKDPTGQVRVEALPPSHSSTMSYTVVPPKESLGTQSPGSQNQQSALPQCQALEYGILETIKRRYRYRLLQEVMDAFDERAIRRKVADSAEYPIGSRGMREGDLASVGDGMRLLESIWDEVATTTIAKAWQRTKLRPKPKEEPPSLPPGQRAKSEKRQTTREKKQLIKNLYTFLTKHESKDFAKEDGANQLEEMVEKLKNCFLYTDGEVIETKEMMESLEEWIGLEDSQGMISLFMEEIKMEMNIDYLVGLKEPVEGVVPEVEDGEDAQGPAPQLSEAEGRKGKEVAKELDLETAIQLASTIKSTACKLFDHGDLLGELAVQLDDASDSVFRLLRKQKELAEAKKEAEAAKVNARTKAKAAAAAAAAAAGNAAEDGSATEAIGDASTDQPGDLVPPPGDDPVGSDIGNVDLPDMEMTGV